MCEHRLGHGLYVAVNRRGATFADLRVSDADTGEESDIQLGWNYREYSLPKSKA